MKLFKIVLLSLLISTPLYASDEKEAVKHVAKAISQLKEVKEAKAKLETYLSKKLKVTKDIAPYIGFTFTVIAGEVTTNHFDFFSYETDRYDIELDGRYNIHSHHYSIGVNFNFEF